jgi:hypothetical protein
MSLAHKFVVRLVGTPKLVTMVWKINQQRHQAIFLIIVGNKCILYGVKIMNTYLAQYKIFPVVFLARSVGWGRVHLAGDTEELGWNLPQCLFVHHKSHMIWPGIEPGLPRWRAKARSLSWLNRNSNITRYSQTRLWPSRHGYMTVSHVQLPNTNF